METTKVISKITAIFNEILPAQDRRCKIQPVHFIAALICGFATTDGRVKCMSALRKTVVDFTQEKLARSTFWGRMSTKKMTHLLRALLSALISEICVQLQVGQSLLSALNISKILLLDSSSLTLPDGASADFPAPRNNVVPAAAKVHVLHDLFGGIAKWFSITPATTHDRREFPPLSLLKGSLIIFDLGYWDFQLLNDMILGGIHFLSRVKSNSRVEIIDVIRGVSRTCIGFDLHSGRFDSFRGEVVEVIGKFIISKTKIEFESRIIGFWSTTDSSYHWYVTNLKSSSDIIYPLYRLRWQLELVFKAWKSVLHLDEIISENKNIIINFTLIGMCAALISKSLSISVINEEVKEKQAAFSVQRAVSFLIRIGHSLFLNIKRKVRWAKKLILEQISLFKEELYDPNYKSRINSLHHACLGSVKME
jgi:putative transposase